MTKRRRRSERVKRRLPAQAWKQGEKDPVSGVTRDFSAEGLFFETRHPFLPGSKIMIELAFSGRKIQLEGVVSRANKAESRLRAIQISGMGVKVEFSREQERELVTDPRPKRRVEIDSTVVMYFGSDSQQVKLRNLSTSGVAVESESKLQDISFVRILFKLTESSYPIEINAVPVRSEDTENGTLIGMRFLDPPDQVVAEIEKYVNGIKE